jgi:hypothetical protein
MAGRSLTHSEQWWASQRPDHVMRCTASLKRDGSQCRREAMVGTNVCGQHGGLAPAVQAAAATRIQMSVEDAAKALKDLAFDENGDPRVRLKAIQDLLDRGGLAPTSKVLLGVVTEDPIEKLFASIAADPSSTYDPREVQAQALPRARDAAQEALDAAEQGPDWDDLYGPADEAEEDLIGDVVDAELVEPGAEPEVVSSKPPKHILKDLERLGLL